MSDRSSSDRQGAEPGGFLSRWSQRKASASRGEQPPEPVPVARVPVASPALRTPPSPPFAPSANAAPGPAAIPAPSAEPRHATPDAAVPRPPAPTLDDVAALDAGADVRRFVAPGVGADVKNAALKKLFADPHFNVMDGLDTYIDDYSQPDPLPVGMLRQMAQAHALGLFADEPATQAALTEPGVDARPIPAPDELLGPNNATPALAHAPAEPQASVDNHLPSSPELSVASGRDAAVGPSDPVNAAEVADVAAAPTPSLPRSLSTDAFTVPPSTS